MERFRSEVEILVSPASTFDALRRAAVGMDAVVVRTQLPEDIFDVAMSLRAAVRHGVGFDMIPVDAATRCGVPVANVPAVNASTVAEFAVMQILALARRQQLVRRGMADRDWARARTAADESVDLAGRTLGVVGFGNSGSRAAAIAHHAFGMRVLASTPRPETLPAWVSARALGALCAESDFVLVACPLNARTEGLIGRDELARMKPSAYLVNVARGKIVDEAALLEALRHGKIAGAALDVHAATPLPADHPIHELPNVILTPHTAGITDDAMERVASGAVAQAIQILDDERPPHLVNPEVWPVRRRSETRVAV
jgi:D-3-phosphoglycerate dehydrogenase